VEEIMQDLRYAWRGLRQKPLFAVIAILSIGIGVGANSVMFSVVNALLLRAPGGIGSPERVVEVGRSTRGAGFDTFSYPELEFMQGGVPSLDAVAGTRQTPMSFTDAGGAGQRVSGMAVSQPYFKILGTSPYKGRFFSVSEDASPGSAHVTVVSYEFWKRQLGGAADVVGRTIELNREAFTVIGVTQPEFHGHMPIMVSDVYIPLTMFGSAERGFDDYRNMHSSWLQAVARLAPGATVARANADLAVLFDRLRQQYPEVYGDAERSASVMQLGGVPAGAHGPIAGFLSLLMGLVALVLLTTCANVAGMLVARAAARERENSISLAIGSGRARLVRQLLIESLLLFGLGGVAGILLSIWCLRLLSGVALPVPVVLNFDFSPDMRVFAFGLGVSLLTGIMFGLAPALQATRPSLTGALRSEGSASHSRGGRLRRIFVVSQVSFSLVLLISAGLFLRSLQRASRIDAGFDADGVQLVTFDLALDGYDEAAGRTFIQRLTTRLEGMPGVSAAAVATDLPLDMSISEAGTFPAGRSEGARPVSASFNEVTPGYFNAVGMRVLQGRAFSAADVTSSEPVIIVSSSYAERVWPGEAAIGKRVAWSDPSSSLRTVVGVVNDVKTKNLMEGTEPTVYLPQSQAYSSNGTLLVRTGRSGRAAAEFVEQQIAALDPRLSISAVQTLAGVTSVGTLPQRLAARVATSLGVLALVLAALGIYGVTAYMVTQRTREIAVRVAIGARRADVISIVIGSGLKLALPGLVIGTLAALGFSLLLRAFILGVAPMDALTFTVVPALLLLMIGVATAVPALRAARVSPMDALRSE
jgi:predicted permease